MSELNCVLVVADDMGYGDLGLFNEGRCRTPNLDALARDGICLTQHYSGSPVCAPARACLLTGKYPHRTGAIDTLHGRGLDRIALGERTIADIFSSGGYRTGLIGKWHNGALDARFHPNARGFEEFVGFCGGYSDYYDYYLDVNGAEQKGDGRYLTDVLTEQAIGFVRRHRSEAFFLVVAYNAPHFPMQAPETVVQRYVGAGYSMGAALTYAMIEVMDAGIGRLLTELSDLRLIDDTIFLFTSDNGPYLGEVAGVSLDRFNFGLRGAKHYVFEGGVRVPTIVHWPAGWQGGGVVDHVLHFADWLPTLAHLGSLPLPGESDLDGRDITPALAGNHLVAYPRRFWQNNRYAPHVEGNAAVRDGQWKLVRPPVPEFMTVTDSDRMIDRALNLHEEGRIVEVDTSPLPEFDGGPAPGPMLFDIALDPFEHNDLASEHPEKVATMTSELERWFESVEQDRQRSLLASR
jgi:arylsulfatase A-like enzyme